MHCYWHELCIITQRSLRGVQVITFPRPQFAHTSLHSNIQLAKSSQHIITYTPSQVSINNCGQWMKLSWVGKVKSSPEAFYCESNYTMCGRDDSFGSGTGWWDAVTSHRGDRTLLIYNAMRGQKCFIMEMD